MAENLFFFGKSITGSVARSVNWDETTLGKPESWPDSLKLILGMLFENKQPVCLFWGPEHKYFYNDGYIPIVGAHKHPWAMGKKGQVVWNEIWEYLLPQIQQVLNGGEATWNEDQYLPILGDDGNPRDAFFTYSYSPVFEPNGKINGVLVTCTETTNRVVAEKKLIESQGRFRQIGEALPQLVWTCRADGWCDYFSRQWIEYTGIPESDQLGFSWLDKVIHPDDKDRTTEHWLGAVEGKHAYDIEYRIRRYDGEYRWFKTRGTPIRDADGKITYWFGTCTDIQDSKEAQLNFERNVDASPSMLWITEKDGYCTYLSKQWYENTGLTPEIGLGFGWLEATHPDDMVKAGEVFRDANARHVPFYHEYRLRHKTGEYRWSIDSGNPRYDEKGEYLGMAGAVFDIHDRKLAEIKIEEALRARDEFLSIASHELKTPLTTLKLQTQLQKKINKQDEPRELPKRFNTFLDLTDKQITRLSRLVDDMLDVSRIRTGKLTFEIEEIDFCDLVSDVINSLSDQFTKSSYAIPVIPRCTNARGHWDRMRLEQIVTNLLTNAIRYGNKKEISVAIDADDKNVILIVKDKGIGISSNDQVKIFDRFERSVNANDVSGLGLGLYITKQIVRSFRGEITVESSLGEGSTFRVVIPK